MKPAPFEYYAPKSIEEALENLASAGYGAKILAGGQSLVPAMNFRMAQPSALVDINRIPELAFIRNTGDGGLMIGTMTRAATVEFDKLVAQRAPIFQEALPFCAHPQIRNRGTFGGAISHADPAAQLPVCAVAMDCKYHLRSTTAERWVTSEDFFVTLFTTTMEPDEMLVEVAVPGLAAKTATSYYQVARQSGAGALCGVATRMTLDEKGNCKDVRLVYMGVGEKPILSVEASKVLVGNQVTPEAITEAVENCVSNELDPGADIHASVEYRRHMALVLGKKSLTVAHERAQK
jgi:aerobic carbon-monoxide dehydrogenase medium subunit